MSAASDCDALVLAQWRAKGLDYAADVVEELVAERHQAIDERDEAILALHRAGSVRERELSARCEQAIDALREIAAIEDSFQAQSRYTGTVATCFHDCPAMARAALVSLGETP